MMTKFDKVVMLKELIALENRADELSNEEEAIRYECKNVYDRIHEIETLLKENGVHV